MLFIRHPTHVAIFLLMVLHYVACASEPTIPNNGAAAVKESNHGGTAATPSTLSPTPSATHAAIVPTYKVMNGSDICLLVQLDLALKVPYFNTTGNQQTIDILLNSTNLPESYNGTCLPEREELHVYFGREVNSSSSIHVAFDKPAADSFRLSHFSFNYTLTTTVFPDTNATGERRVLSNAPLLTCSTGSYFQCMSRQTLTLTKAPEDANVQPDVLVTITAMKIEAFRSGPSTDFVGYMTECVADYVPDKLVPITVGVTLAVMIVIAITVFIITSRRRRTGYQEL